MGVCLRCLKLSAQLCMPCSALPPFESACCTPSSAHAGKKARKEESEEEDEESEEQATSSSDDEGESEEVRACREYSNSKCVCSHIV